MQATPGSHHRRHRLVAVLAATALAAPAAAAGQAGAAQAAPASEPAAAGRYPQAPVPGPARGQGLVRTFSAPAGSGADHRFDWTAAGAGAGTAGALGLLVHWALHAHARTPRRLVG
jgi:hypothetical protein